jgi:hypothetical protein
MMRERSGWRELDSNHRSRGRPAVVVASALVCVAFPLAANQMSPSRNLLSRGTDGSSPASSSGESHVRTGTFDDLAMATLGEMMRPVVLEDGRIGVQLNQWILQAARAINNNLG